jgi:hypothetical protein
MDVVDESHGDMRVQRQNPYFGARPCLVKPLKAPWEESLEIDSDADPRYMIVTPIKNWRQNSAYGMAKEIPVLQDGDF